MGWFVCGHPIHALYNFFLFPFSLFLSALAVVTSSSLRCVQAIYAIHAGILAHANRSIGKLLLYLTCVGELSGGPPHTVVIYECDTQGVPRVCGFLFVDARNLCERAKKVAHR